MTSKTYTAQEMRDFAEAIAGDLCDNGHKSVKYTYDDLIPVIEALRQAADAMEREGNKCGDCAKFGSDCSAGDVDGNEDCRACDKFISKETAAKDAEIAELQRRLKVAEKALVACRDGMCGECHRQHPGEACVCPNGCYEMSMTRTALAAIRGKGGAK